MEDVGTVLVDIDTGYILAADIPPWIKPPVDDKASPAPAPRQICEHGPVESGTDYEIIIQPAVFRHGWPLIKFQQM